MKIQIEKKMRTPNNGNKLKVEMMHKKKGKLKKKSEVF